MHGGRRGFIALFSVLTLSALLLLLVAGASTAAYLAHRAAFEEMSYRTAQQAAFSCARFALSRLDADPSRFDSMGTTTIVLSNDSVCDITSADRSADTARVAVTGRSEMSSVPISFTATRAASSASFALTSWTEY